MPLPGLETLRPVVQGILERARIPGAGLAIVEGSEVVYAEAFGYRDLGSKLPLTPDTSFPIASTTKGMNGTLLAMLAQEGRLSWDVPVRRYLPTFEMHDKRVGEQVTLRDLVIMRTGLAPHDFVWMENPITRSELVNCLPHLPLALPFRERYQYNNLTPTLAGHIAEVVSGKSWEDLLRERLFSPLGMSATDFVPPQHVPTTVAYHENLERELRVTECFAAEPIGPAGGSIYSTVIDMGKWIALNLNQGKFSGCQVIAQEALERVHSPSILMGDDPAAPSPHATYGLGWFIDRYNGLTRISHTGHLHDVHSSVMLFPQTGIGLVSFINFASSRIATLINEHALQHIFSWQAPLSLQDALSLYENKIATNCKRLSGQRRAAHTAPSHKMDDYTGIYSHPGYGKLRIERSRNHLVFARGRLTLPLEHWHYDTWAVRENEIFEIHKPHSFDGSARLVFRLAPDGDVNGFSIGLDPTVPDVCFTKQPARL